MNSEDIDFTDAKKLREKAEEQLKKVQKKEHLFEGEADLKKLIHELQVHQIELEMQNEELILAREIAEALLKKYTLLFDLSPLGYFTLNSEGVILDLNFTGAEILRERRFSLLNSNFRLFVSEESKKAFNLFLEKLYSTYQKSVCEISLECKDSSTSFVYIEGIVTEDDQKCFITILDISRFRS